MIRHIRIAQHAVVSGLLACTFAVSAQVEAPPAQAQASTDTAAQAQQDAQAATAPAGEAPVETGTQPQRAAAKTVPALQIVWNCGKCEQNPKIVPLIQERYAMEANEAGYTVSSDARIAAEIVDFRQRNPGMRIMFGVMSGKDRLQLKLIHNGVEHTVGDSSANIIQGQNALCADVAQQIYKLVTRVQNAG